MEAYGRLWCELGCVERLREAEQARRSTGLRPIMPGGASVNFPDVRKIHSVDGPI